MSKVGHRRQPTRGRTRTASTVTEGRKSGGTTKVPSRSGSVRSVVERRGSSAGSTQRRKSVENAPNMNCTAGVTASQDSKPVPQRAPSKIRNENVPMHDSSNHSIPQTIPPNSITGKGCYRNRFGHVHPIIIDLTQTPIPTTISNNVTSTQNNHNDQQLKTDMSEFTANTASDHPKINEICWNYLRFRCLRGNRCNRLHPPRGTVTRTRPKIDEICINFTNGRCYWGELCDRIHPSAQDSKPNDSTALSELNLPASAVEIDAERTIAEDTCTASSQISIPTVDCSSITANVEESQVAGLSNILPIEIKTNESRDLWRTKNICRRFLVHRCGDGHRCRRWHPPAGDLPQVLAEQEARPKRDVICQQFLRGRCCWGTICNLTHPVDTQLDESATSNLVQNTADASEGNQTVSTSSTDPAPRDNLHASKTQPELDSKPPISVLGAGQQTSVTCSNVQCHSTDKRSRLHPVATSPISIAVTSSEPAANDSGQFPRDVLETGGLRSMVCSVDTGGKKEDVVNTGTIDAEILALIPADVDNVSVSTEIRPAQPASLSTELRLETAGPSSQNLRPPPRPKQICRNYLIDRCRRGHRCQRYHPPQAERLQLLEAERSRPKLSQVCQSFLGGGCRRGVLCDYTHSRLNHTTLDEFTCSSMTPPSQRMEDSGKTTCPSASASAKLGLTPIATQKIDEPHCAHDQYHNGDNYDLQSLLSPSSVVGGEEIRSSNYPLNNSNGTRQADDGGLMHKTKGPTTSIPREVCRKFLNGIQHNKQCRYLHLPLDQQQNPSAKEQVDDRISVDDHEKSSGSDSDTSSVDHGSFSRSLVDASNTTDTPLVNMPKAGGFSKRAGRHKKKKVPEKLSSSTPSMTTEATMSVCCKKLLIDIPIVTEAPIDNGVVKLPSPQGRLSGSSDVIGGAQTNLAFFAESFADNTNSGSCTTITHTMPPPSELCIDWLRGRCSRGENCKYLHVNQPGSHDHSHIDRQSERDSAEIHTTVLPQVCLEQDKYSPPRQNQKQCESVLPPPSVPALPNPAPVREPPPYMTVTVLEHTKVNLGAGFEVKDITTGFESRWVILGNIPSSVTEKTIRRTLKVFGQVDDLRMPVTSSTSTVNIKALFSSAAEAIQAAGALNGAQLFDRRISARLPLNNTARGNGTFQDCSVRIEWDVPGRTGYAGYPDLAEAEAAVLAANGLTLRDSCITASIYEGIPALGAFNVRFAGLPPTADAQDLKQFGAPEEVMLERPNYMSIGNAAKAIQGLLKEVGEVLSFDLPPPPRKDRVVRAWAHFASPTLAQTASAHLNGRRPFFIGKGKLSVRHVQALSYTLPVDVYDKLASDIAGLRHSFWHQGRGAVLSIVDRRADRQHDPSIPVFIKLSGEDVGALGHLKAEFEKLLHGEILMQDGKVIWDGFLERSAGFAFLQEVERAHPGVSIQKAIGRRTITLFGPISKRRNVRRMILDKINRIRAQQTWVIPLTGRLIGLFMSAELMALQQSLGHENVILNLLRCTLTIRGNDAAYEAAQRAVHQVQTRHPEGRKENIVECPVCFNQVVSPITLQCGHSWCKSCLSNYFVASIDNKIFPLRCLGAEATCSQLIPVAIARDILCANEFDAVVNASFLAYIYARSDEFHYCPTPDCPQIYRSAPPDTILQCPSCLTRICPSCHVEAHDGMTCAIRDVDGEKLFKEWMDAHDVKNCPGCKAAIERTEGCNHMTCSRCQTHICWVCMETFPKGEGIYDHMRMAHGGIGL